MTDQEVRDTCRRTEGTSYTRELTCIYSTVVTEDCSPLLTADGYWVVDGDDAGFTLWRLYEIKEQP